MKHYACILEAAGIHLEEIESEWSSLKYLIYDEL